MTRTNDIKLPVVILKVSSKIVKNYFLTHILCHVKAQDVNHPSPCDISSFSLMPALYSTLDHVPRRGRTCTLKRGVVCLSAQRRVACQTKPLLIGPTPSGRRRLVCV